mmetsp:Transcript_26536/g.4651  ORF Transcript_26536/g.4651 Transcript_26536/m.4651 type:complete len:125 (+) Transcript_26536:7945-8319(+)
MELKFTVDNAPAFVSAFIVLPSYLDFTTFNCLGGCAALVANTAVTTFSMSPYYNFVFKLAPAGLGATADSGTLMHVSYDKTKFAVLNGNLGKISFYGVGADDKTNYVGVTINQLQNMGKGIALT